MTKKGCNLQPFFILQIPINIGMSFVSAAITSNLRHRDPPLDPDFDSVVLLLPLDGTDGATTTTDFSNTLNTITFSGTAQLDTAIVKYGTASLLLDGNSDYISTPDSTDWYPGTGDYTVEAHINVNDFDGPRLHSIIANRQHPATRGWQFLVNTTPTIALTCWDAASGVTVNFAGTTTLSTGTWYHVAFTKEGTTWRLFIDGNLENTATETGTIGDAVQPLQIGIDPSNSSRYFWGNIDNVRITKGVARYTSSFTPPGRAYPTGPFE
jgi:hypothetical protein